MAEGGPKICEVDLGDVPGWWWRGWGKATGSLVQSSGDAETQSQRETGGFRRARGERNLKSLVVQGRCAGLGQVHVSGTDGLESKSTVDRQVCGTIDPAQGRRHGAKAHTRTDGEGCQYPMGKVEQPSSDEQAQDGRDGQLCAEWPENAVIWSPGAVQLSNPSWWEPGAAGLVSSQLCALRARRAPRPRRLWAARGWSRPGSVDVGVLVDRPMLSCWCTAAVLCRRGRLAQIEMLGRRSRGRRRSR